MTDLKLQIIPLGGCGEFGMNMTAIRYADDIIVIDSGMMFPEAELLGVDLVMPDMSFLKENQQFVRALILTHGHEDHIGAVPYFLSEIGVPVYGTDFTLALVDRRLEEYDLEEDPRFIHIKPKQILEIGPFKIEFIRVTHSIVSSVALAITTPLGVVIHTGDFKVDPTPTDNELFDLHTLADYGKRGVLLLLSDSTNADRPGYTESERAVRPRMEEIFNRAERRVIVSCFSSSIHRIQLVLDLSQEYGRDPTSKEIGDKMGMSPDKVREIIKVAQLPISLELPMGEEEDSHLGDFIEDRNALPPVDAASKQLLKEQIDEVLSSLTHREQRVLVLRFGLEDGRSRTLEEVGQEFNVTRERIRQIEAKALRKLRHPSRSRKLKDYLE